LGVVEKRTPTVSDSAGGKMQLSWWINLFLQKKKKGGGKALGKKKDKREM